MTEREQEEPSALPHGPGGSTAGVTPAGATAPPWSTGPVVLRRPDVLAGLLLLLAGIAAAASLVLPWLADAEGFRGLDLVRRALGDLDGLVATGLWQPLVVVLGGAALLVLGLWALVPARDHRLVGLLALVLSAAAAAAVLVPLVQARWSPGFFGPGFWCAVAVAVLGLAGSLTAVVTGPRRPR